MHEGTGTGPDLCSDDSRPDMILTMATAALPTTPSRGHAGCAAVRVAKHARTVMQANEVVVARVAIAPTPPGMLSPLVTFEVLTEVRTTEVIVRIRIRARVIHHLGRVNERMMRMMSERGMVGTSGVMAGRGTRGRLVIR